MTVKYLGHSGFWIETERVQYLFDYIRGDLPENAGEKPLYVFASHIHRDHFAPALLFAEPLLSRTKEYFFGFDIRKLFERKREQWLNGADPRVTFCGPEGELETEDFHLTLLHSTDEGVAFYIREGDVNIYHAGDLNWWHWDQDEYSVNRDREVRFKRQIGPIGGERIDAACVPLDPRLSGAYRFGMDHFLEITDAKAVFPMHFWEDYDLIVKYRESLPPEKKEKIRVISRENQEFTV